MARLVDWTFTGRPSGAATRKAAPPLTSDMIGDALREFADLARILEDPDIILDIAAERSGQPVKTSKEPYRHCPSCAELSPDKVTLLNGACVFAYVAPVQSLCGCASFCAACPPPPPILNVSHDTRCTGTPIPGDDDIRLTASMDGVQKLAHIAQCGTGSVNVPLPSGLYYGASDAKIRQLLADGRLTTEAYIELCTAADKKKSGTLQQTAVHLLVQPVVAMCT
jgi:hypothetical protein